MLLCGAGAFGDVFEKLQDTHAGTLEVQKLRKLVNQLMHKNPTQGTSGLQSFCSANAISLPRSFLVSALNSLMDILVLF